MQTDRFWSVSKSNSVPDNEDSTPFSVALAPSSDASLVTIRGVNQLRVQRPICDREPQVRGVDGHHALSSSHVQVLREFQLSSFAACEKVVVSPLKRAVSVCCHKCVHQHFCRVSRDTPARSQVIGLDLIVELGKKAQKNRYWNIGCRAGDNSNGL